MLAGQLLQEWRSPSQASFSRLKILLWATGPTIPGGGAGWLGVTQEKGYYDAGLLWGGGSVVPVSSVFFSDDSDTLFVTRINEVKRKDTSGKVVRTQQFPEVIMAKLDGDELALTRIQPRDNGRGMVKEVFTGKRIPPVPAAPDLSKVKFGSPIQLLNGKDLDGLKLTDPGAKNGWSVENGILVNHPLQPEGKHLSYGNLQTEKEFEDFNVSLEARVDKGQNSGIYLRGIYEVQVCDSYGRQRSIPITWEVFIVALHQVWRQKKLPENGRRSTSRWWTGM